ANLNASGLVRWRSRLFLRRGRGCRRDCFAVAERLDARLRATGGRLSRGRRIQLGVSGRGVGVIDRNWSTVVVAGVGMGVTWDVAVIAGAKQWIGAERRQNRHEAPSAAKAKARPYRSHELCRCGRGQEQRDAEGQSRQEEIAPRHGSTPRRSATGL